MTGFDAKANLRVYLQGARETLLWKLDGLSEYDVRRPLTPTGTNLLGLVKHQAGGELIYFGDVFGRPHGEQLPWLGEDADGNEGMWAAPDETRDAITSLYRRAWKHADATIAELPLDAPATVPWWGEGAEVTLCHILVHMTAEAQRHAGHADIVRELIDGSVGLLRDSRNMPSDDPAWWHTYQDRVERAARAAGSLSPHVIASTGRPRLGPVAWRTVHGPSGAFTGTARIRILLGQRPGEDPRDRQRGQQVRGTQEGLAFGGRQLGEHAVLVALYVVLHPAPGTAPGRGDREQPGTPVRRVRLARDQARRLEVVKGGDDAGLVRADLLRQGGLGALGRVMQGVQDHVSPHRDAVPGQHGKLRLDERPHDRLQHGGQVPPPFVIFHRW
jgi:hypothetical protein